MSDDSYNEGLKYPLFHMHPADPKIISESKRLLGDSIIQDRILNFFRDTLSIPMIGTRKLKQLVSSVFIIPDQDLDLPFHQLVDYQLKPIITGLQKELKYQTVESLIIGFERIKRGLKVRVSIYG